MVKFIGQDGFYPKWAQGVGRWVHQRVLVITGGIPPIAPLEASKWLVWVPPKSSFLGLRKVSPQVEASHASTELNQIPFRCTKCGWTGMGSKLECYGDPSSWILDCPECFVPVEPDLRSLSTEVIIRQWERLGRPVLENPGAAPEILSIRPISDLRSWIDSFEPMPNELAYIGQQLWPTFADFVRDAQDLESYHHENEETFRQEVNGIIYFGSEGNKLYALDALTGKIQWSYETGGEIHSTPTVASGMVYFGSWDGKLYALDALTGELKWNYETGDCINSSPAMANGIVYFGSWDNKLYALDASTGKLKWLYKTGGRILCSPTVADATVYFGSEDGNWYAINAKDGSVRWSFKRQMARVDDEEFGYVCPGVVNGSVLFVSSDEKLHALETETGKPKWTYYDPKRYEEDSLGGVEHVAIGEFGIIFCSGIYIGVLALDGKTGEVIWNYDEPEFAMLNISGPMAVANGMVYVGGDEVFLALEAQTGRVLWRYDNKAFCLSSCASVVHRVVCFVAENQLFALDSLTGHYRWSCETEHEISTSPAIVLSPKAT